MASLGCEIIMHFNQIKQFESYHSHRWTIIRVRADRVTHGLSQRFEGTLRCFCRNVSRGSFFARTRGKELFQLRLRSLLDRKFGIFVLNIPPTERRSRGRLSWSRFIFHAHSPVVSLRPQMIQTMKCRALSIISIKTCQKSAKDEKECSAQSSALNADNYIKTYCFTLARVKPFGPLRGTEKALNSGSSLSDSAFITLYKTRTLLLFAIMLYLAVIRARRREESTEQVSQQGRRLQRTES